MYPKKWACFEHTCLIRKPEWLNGSKDCWLGCSKKLEKTNSIVHTYSMNIWWIPFCVLWKYQEYSQNSNPNPMTLIIHTSMAIIIAITSITLMNGSIRNDPHSLLSYPNNPQTAHGLEWLQHSNSVRATNVMHHYSLIGAINNVPCLQRSILLADKEHTGSALAPLTCLWWKRGQSRAFQAIAIPSN